VSISEPYIAWKGPVPTRDRPTFPQMPERVAEIIREVAAIHGVTAGEIIGPSHLRAIVWPRFEAAYRIRELRMADGRPPSYPRIGRWLGGRDHTTIIAGIRRHEALTDPKQRKVALAYQTGRVNG
jgi:chromosomal replication initiation ATPase DnaA